MTALDLDLETLLDLESGAGDGKVLVLVGPPASGKSTITHALLKDGAIDTWVASDEVRLALTGAVDDFSREAEVWEAIHLAVSAVVKGGGTIAVDATNLVPKNRATYLNIAPGRAVAVPVSVPIPELIRRNDARVRTVPDEVMNRMIRQFLTDCHPLTLAREGFAVDQTYFKDVYAPGQRDPSVVYRACKTCGR